MWNRLSAPWRACVELAWEAYCAGSLPIGAVVVNGAGEIVGRGRNSTRDAGGAPLNEHQLAHAEVNALLATDFGQHAPADCTLYASTEPCPLCIGALVMANIKRVTFASRDPWAGGVELLVAGKYMRSQGVQVVQPEAAELEAALVALQVERHLSGDERRAQPLLAAWRAICPQGVARGEELFASGELGRVRDEGESAKGLLGVLGSKD